MSTPYHSQYWAHELTLEGAAGRIERLSRSIANARVDLNPHQVDAALFALRSPFSQGAILADEVGLGKTIEAGIVMAQRWAERRRRILLVVPATLRTQWQAELAEKFYLPALILDSKTAKEANRQGIQNPFDQPGQVIICSYNFTAQRQQQIQQVPWDLAVLDEAHRLRNVYKGSSKLARKIVDTLRAVPKLLLTATPLQNSLMELYGLVSAIDPHVFGDARSFRAQFVNASDEEVRNRHLRARLAPLCHRTLRKQVIEYVPFTRRTPITQEFRPSDDEHALYELVSEYLQREELLALPTSQRKLITLVLRKLLASSTFAIAKTLQRLVTRLEELAVAQGIVVDAESVEQELADLVDDYSGFDEVQEEYKEAESDGEDKANGREDDDPIGRPTVDPERLRHELAELRGFVALALGIERNAKGETLIPALEEAFAQAERLGAAQKAVIFTESRRTQQYLFDLLTEQGYDGRVVLINGANDDAHSRAIYTAWRGRHEGTALVTGSRPVDMKTALIEHFREEATILIATEAAAEGVNLQFCSLVVNYDLPWNPQRVEQRIGRCHRYGQKHDVLVVNFLNRRNEADQRVFQLLSEKFHLFSGLFGASDEVLGALESGVDIEQRIAEVYQRCRTAEEIRAAFDALQNELDAQIAARMVNTRQALLEHFDEEVTARLRTAQNQTLASLNLRERFLLDLTRVELAGQALFDAKEPSFIYGGSLARRGRYHLQWKPAEAQKAIFYRQDHPLAQQLIDQARGRELAAARLAFDYNQYGARVSVIEGLLGCCGRLALFKLRVESVDVEEFLFFAGVVDETMGPCRVLDQEICQKLMALPAQVTPLAADEERDLSAGMDAICQQEVAQRLHELEARQGAFFDEETLKLDHWADDLKAGLEQEIYELDKALRDSKRTVKGALSLQEKLAAQRAVKELEAERNRKRRRLYATQDEIEARRDDLIGTLEQQLKQRYAVEQIFVVKWVLR